MAKYKKLTQMEWDNIRMNYVTRADEPSYKSLAREFNVPLRTLSKEASENNWTKERKEYYDKLMTRVKDNTSNDILKKIHKRRIEYVKGIDIIIGKSVKRMINRAEEGTNILSVKEMDKLIRLREFLLGHSDTGGNKVDNLTINLNKDIDDMTEKERKLLNEQLNKIESGDIEEIEDAEYIELNEE